ncbi:hypothetical protein BV25DRAFT_1923837 [Artomyces pyxidatus]|uniref:Uncharacterized protein n=1 Tax=Artomyces pyxidatus TaxID=48021 RepID=A0ACB8TJM9_9AGAM|nr:hypothetical protein BV25DRAFT_1923837 [Artomyces pyxidatus]
MPHKRSKRSVRDQQRNERGTDLAPTGGTSAEGIPKSVSRVLDAAKVRQDFRQKKRKLADAEDDGQSSKRRRRDAEGAKEILIKPGESLKHFNRRVEDDMRPLVRSAMQTSSAVGRKARKDQTKAKDSKADYYATDSDRKQKTKAVADPPVPSSEEKHKGRPKEFSKLSTSTPRRLNDIAMAPPDLNKPPRGTTRMKAADGTSGRGSSVLSMAQKAMMDTEREKVIKRYREMKEKKRVSGRALDENPEESAD